MAILNSWHASNTIRFSITDIKEEEMYTIDFDNQVIISQWVKNSKGNWTFKDIQTHRYIKDGMTEEQIDEYVRKVCEELNL